MLTGMGRKINPKLPGEEPVRYVSGSACQQPCCAQLSGSEAPKHLVTVSRSSHAFYHKWAVGRAHACCIHYVSLIRCFEQDAVISQV